jgi:hypothetical protein
MYFFSMNLPPLKERRVILPRPQSTKGMSCSNKNDPRWRKQTILDMWCEFVGSVTCSVGIKRVPASGLPKSVLCKPLFSDGRAQVFPFVCLVKIHPNLFTWLFDGQLTRNIRLCLLGARKTGWRSAGLGGELAATLRYLGVGWYECLTIYASFFYFLYVIVICSWSKSTESLAAEEDETSATKRAKL